MKTSRSKTTMPGTGHTLSVPVLAEESSLSTLHPNAGLLSRAWGWIRARRTARSSTRRLRVAETVSLGEKRFVAVVQVDGRHFLLAGGPTNIALLAQLDAKDDFGGVLKKTLTSRKQPAKRRRIAPAREPSNIALRTTLNGAQPPEQLLKKTTPANKQPPRQTRKQKPRAEERTNAPLMAHLNGTGAFGDLLNHTMTAPARQPEKQAGKLNSAPGIERLGEYA